MPDALYLADEEGVFCITYTMQGNAEDVEGPYTEMDLLSPEELRFIASIYLCEIRDEAAFRFYPVSHYAPVLNRTKLDLSKPSTVEAARQLVIRGLDFPEYGHYAPVLQECHRLRYDLVDRRYSGLERQPAMLQGIKKSDKVLLRGINALIKADMLSCYSEFTEEATISCFVAMDASFQLILNRLRSEGMRNPTAKDAAKWVYRHFDSQFGHAEPSDPYFAEFYEQRIQTLHSSNRFGEFLYAPLMVDDFYHLRDSLRSIFAYIVSGEHDRGFLEEVRKYGPRQE